MPLPLPLRCGLADLFRAEGFAAELDDEEQAEYLHGVADELHAAMSNHEYEMGAEAFASEGEA